MIFNKRSTLILVIISLSFYLTGCGSTSALLSLIGVTTNIHSVSTDDDLHSNGTNIGLRDYYIKVGDQELEINWPQSTDPSFDHYDVYRDGVQIATVNSVTDLSYLDAGVSNDVQYTYQIVVKDATDSTLNALVEISDEPKNLPPDSISLSGLAGIEMISLNWEQSTAPDFLRYELYRDGFLVKIESNIASVNYTNTGLDFYNEYRYQMRVVDVSGNISEFSPSIIIKPNGC